MVALKKIYQEVNGFGTMSKDNVSELFDSTTDEYADIQMEINVEKTLSYILPIAEKLQAKSILDVGCGVGTMVKVLMNHGFDAYGVDLITLAKYWEKQGLDKAHFFLAEPYKLELPFEDNSLDFVFTLGAIEHIGTSDGHADRLPDYHMIRKEWLREIYRVVKPSGHMLIGGPNRNFPIDTAHGLDSKASKVEKKLTEWLGTTVHKTWGANFLWGYSDIEKYLSDLPYEMEGLSVSNYAYFSRVPNLLKGLSKLYVDKMPKPLLKTGLNPWMMALITKN